MHRHAFAHWRFHLGDEGIKVGNDLFALHETVRVAAVVRVAGQGALPVGGYQAEIVPALGTPAVGETVLFQHQVVDTFLLQVVAGGEASLAAANDDDAVMGNRNGLEGTGHGKLQGKWVRRRRPHRVRSCPLCSVCMSRISTGSSAPYWWA
ncbi:hypothetical protein FQZ97_1095170 [compost metagenome]